jgi:hypothetical protein
MPNRRDKAGRLRLREPPERYRAFRDGTLDFADLDDEEVRRMQLRAKDGTFKGRPPASLPREFMLGLQAENHRRMQARWQEEYETAMGVIHELMVKKNPLPADAVRLNAANMVVERLQGKAIDRIEVKATISKFDQVAGDIIMDLDDPRALDRAGAEIEEEDDL